MTQNKKKKSFRTPMMLGIAAICLLALTTLPGCKTPPPPVLIEGSDFYWGTNHNERVLCLTKTGYLKIVGFKVDFKK